MSNYVGLTALALHRLELLDIAKHTNVTDELTGVYNRRFFNEILSKQLSLAKRRNEHLSLVILDLDNFKSINDAYGHSTGDRILQQIARILSDSVSKSDIIARYGGEEFTIIMPTLFTTKALVKSDDIRKIIEYTNFDNIVSGKTFRLTVSMGVASFPRVWYRSGDTGKACEQSTLSGQGRGQKSSSSALEFHSLKASIYFLVQQQRPI